MDEKSDNISHKSSNDVTNTAVKTKKNGEKSELAVRTITEVAEDLNLPQHVLRFWETRFRHLRPMKRAGGRRYYRPVDIALLIKIRHLLYDQGYTIKGVQKIITDVGIREFLNSATGIHKNHIKLFAPDTKVPNEDLNSNPSHIQTQQENNPQISHSESENARYENIEPVMTDIHANEESLALKKLSPSLSLTTLQAFHLHQEVSDILVSSHELRSLLLQLKN